MPSFSFDPNLLSLSQIDLIRFLICVIVFSFFPIPFHLVEYLFLGPLRVP